MNKTYDINIHSNIQTLNANTIKLFNSIVVDGSGKTYQTPVSDLRRMIRNGYLMAQEIKPTNETLSLIESIIGLSGEKANATLHKSWGKVANAPIEQLWVEQVLHYITTIGFETLGFYSEDTVFIPAEQLDIPEITVDMPLIVIKAVTKEQLYQNVMQLVNSGIALSQETINSLTEIVKSVDFSKSFVRDYKSIKNREFKAVIMDMYDIVPDEPVEFLRYVVYKLTGETLVIKNKKLISMLSQADADDVDFYMRNAPSNLGSIFLRYKDLFLAMKSASHNKTVFNQLRKKAVYQHEPLSVDYLNDVTNQISNGVFSLESFKKAIGNYPIWRVIRVMYALNNRLYDGDSIVYRVRNGKSWTTDNLSFSRTQKSTAKVAVHACMTELAERLGDKVAGKTIFIPEGVSYTIPASEKQFVGNFPAGTSVSTPDAFIFGIHWFNSGWRTDLDLSLIDAEGKMGWNGSWRDAGSELYFSGDITDAPAPNGATELFFVGEKFGGTKLINVNTFSAQDDVECRLVISSEAVKVEKSSRYGYRGEQYRNYMLDPNKIIATFPIMLNEHSNVIGLLKKESGQSVIYLTKFSNGNAISSRAGNRENEIREFLMRTTINTLDLASLLELAGANIVHEIPEGDVEYLDYSPVSLDKSTFIGLLSE